MDLGKYMEVLSVISNVSDFVFHEENDVDSVVILYFYLFKNILLYAYSFNLLLLSNSYLLFCHTMYVY
jgi:hypothetical protein